MRRKPGFFRERGASAARHWHGFPASSGLAPLLAAELFSALARVAHESETAILVVEQSARRALKMANRAYLLSLGRIVGEGSAQSLAQDKAVAESYLGL